MPPPSRNRRTVCTCSDVTSLSRARLTRHFRDAKSSDAALARSRSLAPSPREALTITGQFDNDALRSFLSRARNYAESPSLPPPPPRRGGEECVSLSRISHSARSPRGRRFKRSRVIFIPPSAREGNQGSNVFLFQGSIDIWNHNARIFEVKFEDERGFRSWERRADTRNVNMILRSCLNKLLLIVRRNAPSRPSAID